MVLTKKKKKTGLGRSFSAPRACCSFLTGLIPPKTQQKTTTGRQPSCIRVELNETFDGNNENKIVQLLFVGGAFGEVGGAAVGEAAAAAAPAFGG